MKTEEAKQILSKLIGGFDGLTDAQVEWGTAIAKIFYNMGWLDGSSSERAIIELQQKIDREPEPSSDSAHTHPTGPGSISESQNQICGGLKL